MAMSSLLVNINIPYALGALLLAAGFYLWRAAYPRPHAGIPYDKTSARQILGDAPGLLEAATKRGQILQWVAKRCHDLNEPVIQLFLQPFQYPAVVVNDSREAYDILNHRSHEFDRSTFTSDVFEVPVPLHHVRQQMSKQWTYQRRLLSSAIGSSLFIKNAASPKIKTSSLELVELLTKKSHLANGRPFDIVQEGSFVIFDLIWTMMTGTSPGALRSQIDELSVAPNDVDDDPEKAIKFVERPPPGEYHAVDTVSKAAYSVALSPLPGLARWMYKQSSSFRLYKKIKERSVKRGIAAAIETCRASSEAASCIIEAAVRREQELASKDGRAPNFYSPVIQDEIIGNMYAGWSTVSSVVRWYFKYMTKYQDKQEKLRGILFQALEGALDTDHELDAGRILSADIPYMDAFIAELLRLVHPAAGHARLTKVDTTILGHFVPKGTQVFMPAIGSDITGPAVPVAIDESKRSASSRKNKDSHHAWDPNTVADFMPERWLKIDTAGHEYFDKRAGPSLPFGGGPRACPGERLTLAELRILFTILTMKLNFEPIPDEYSAFDNQENVMRQPLAVFVRPSAIDATQARSSKRDSMMMLG